MLENIVLKLSCLGRNITFNFKTNSAYLAAIRGLYDHFPVANTIELLRPEATEAFISAAQDGQGN